MHRASTVPGQSSPGLVGIGSWDLERWRQVEATLTMTADPLPRPFALSAVGGEGLGSMFNSP